MPSEINAFRQYVRVEVTTLDDATIFICLNKPSNIYKYTNHLLEYPDFTVHNMTNKAVLYKQEGTE